MRSELYTWEIFVKLEFVYYLYVFEIFVYSYTKYT